MLSIKSIKLPSIHVDFLLLCCCQVSSNSEYFIMIYVSLMSHMGGKTPISDHRDFFGAFHLCLLDTKIPALEGIRSVMYSAQDMTPSWRSPSKPSSWIEVRNIVVLRIVGSSLTYISHDWASLKSRALHTLSTLFRTAFRSIFPPHLLGIYPRIVFIHHKTRMLSLIWVLNSTAVTAIQLFFLN